LKERIVREVGYGLSLEGASAAALVKSMKANTERAPSKEKAACMNDGHTAADRLQSFPNIWFRPP